VKSTIRAYAKIFLLGPNAPLGDSRTPIQPVSFPSSHQYPIRPISSRPPNSLPFSSPGVHGPPLIDDSLFHAILSSTRRTWRTRKNWLLSVPAATWWRKRWSTTSPRCLPRPP